MINLLPPEQKRLYRYAAINVSLLRWTVAVFVALLGLGAIGTYGWLSMHQSLTASSRQAATIQTSLDKAQLTKLTGQAKDISNSFKLVEKVLGQEILFSQLLKQIATALPNGANLTSLNISQVAGGSGLDVTVEATDYNVATQVQINLASPANKLFAKADINSVSCDNSSTGDYPCKVSLRAQFAQNNPFLFINQKQAKS